MKSFYFIKKKHVWLYFLLLTLAIYGSSIENRYSLDDYLVTCFTNDIGLEEGNERVKKGLRGIPEILTTHYVQDAKISYEYRPMVLISYAIEYQFFKGNAHVSHLINVLLFFMTCTVLFHLLQRIFQQYNWVFPFFITILFIIHPVHSEVVNNLKSRDEIFALLFALLSFRSFLRYATGNRVKHVVYGILLFIVSVLSKGSSIVFLAIIPFTLFVYFKQKAGKLILICSIVLLVLIGITLLVRIYVGQEAGREVLYFENPLFVNQYTFLQKIPIGLYTIGFYVLLVLFPYPLVYYYGYDQVPLAGWADPLAIAAVILLLYCLYYVIRNYKSKSPAVYGIIFFFVSISMFTNVVVPVVGIVGERFTYTASIGFCILVVYVLFRVLKIPLTSKIKTTSKTYSTRPLMFSICFLAGICIIYINMRNADWYDKGTLYRNDIEHLDKSAKAHSLLAAHITTRLKYIKEPAKQQQELKLAIQHYKKALEIYPDYFTSNNNLGTIYYLLGKFDEAIDCFSAALEKRENYYDGHYNIAKTYLVQKDTAKAIRHFEQTIYYDSLGLKYEAYLNLDTLYLLQKKYKDGLRVNKKAIGMYPNRPLYLTNVARFYGLQRDSLQMMVCYENAFRQRPTNVKLCRYILNLYQSMGNADKVKEYSAVLSRLQPAH